MEDAKIIALHASLEEKVATRGNSGGLGFEKKQKAKSKAADGSSKREFATMPGTRLWTR